MASPPSSVRHLRPAAAGRPAHRAPACPSGVAAQPVAAVRLVPARALTRL
jgi:hypothetical protein